MNDGELSLNCHSDVSCDVRSEVTELQFEILHDS